MTPAPATASAIKPAPVTAPAPASARGPARLDVRGRPLLHRATGEFALALLQPTLPEHEIRHHQHDDMHVVVLLAGHHMTPDAFRRLALGRGEVSRIQDRRLPR